MSFDTFYKLKAVLLIVLVCFPVSSAMPEEREENEKLNYRYEEGNRYEYDVNFTVAESLDTGEEYTFEFLSRIILTVKKKRKKSCDFTVFFDDTEFRLQGKDEGSLIVHVPENLEKVKASFRIGSMGQISHVKGFQKLVTGLARKAEKIPGLKGRTIKILISKKYFESMLNVFFCNLERKKNKSGEEEVLTFPPFPFPDKKVFAKLSPVEHVKSPREAHKCFDYDEKKDSSPSYNAKWSISGNVKLSEEDILVENRLKYSWEEVPIQSAVQSYGGRPIPSGKGDASEKKILIRGLILLDTSNEQSQ